MDFKCLKDCINMSSLFKSINTIRILKIKDIYELAMAKFRYLYYQHSFHKTLIIILILLEVIANTFRSITNKSFYFQKQNLSMANVFAVLMELRFGIKFFRSKNAFLSIVWQKLKQLLL